jgi:hypothetical protein
MQLSIINRLYLPIKQDCVAPTPTVDLMIEEQQLLANQPEISIAITLHDHNFSNLKEFTIGQTSTTSITNADESYPSSLSSGLEIMPSSPSMSVESSLAPSHSSPSPLPCPHPSIHSFTQEYTWGDSDYPADSDNVSSSLKAGDSHLIVVDKESDNMSVESRLQSL